MNKVFADEEDRKWCGRDMKILFTVDNYYPRMSGVPVVAKYLAEGLLNQGHEVHIATRWVEGRNQEEDYHGVLIHRFHINHDLRKKPKGTLAEYRKFVLESNFDAIVCECAQCVTTDAILPYLNNYDGKKILHSHGFSGILLKPFQKKSSLRNTIANTINYFNWKNYYGHWLKKYVNQFDAIFCLSEVDSSRTYLEQYAPNKVQILSNAADDIFFEYDEKENSLLKYVPNIDDKYFVSVANYNEYKNQIGILREYYQTSNNNYKMVFVGSRETAYYSNLLKEKDKLDEHFGKRTVYFLTGVERQDIPGIIKNASLYLVGSKFEEFSISLIECMALGTPFISTNVGNARILPGGETIDDISDMHNVIEKILSNQELKNKYSENGRSYTRDNCRICDAVKKLESVLLERE